MIRKIWGVARIEYVGFLTSKRILFLFLGSAAWVWKDSRSFTAWSPYMNELYIDCPEIYALNNQLFIKMENGRLIL